MAGGYAVCSVRNSAGAHYRLGEVHTALNAVLGVSINAVFWLASPLECELTFSNPSLLGIAGAVGRRIVTGGALCLSCICLYGPTTGVAPPL